MNSCFGSVMVFGCILGSGIVALALLKVLYITIHTGISLCFNRKIHLFLRFSD